jgi:hypothetical protein
MMITWYRFAITRPDQTIASRMLMAAL